MPILHNFTLFKSVFRYKINKLLYSFYNIDSFKLFYYIISIDFYNNSSQSLYYLYL